MQNSFSLTLLLSLCFLGALPIQASIFGKDKQQPAPEWALQAAKLTTPANIKDAEAVILSDDHLLTIDEKGRAIERERQATRILKPQGRNDWGYCKASFDVDEKLNYLRAWTLLPDGKQLQAMEADFHEIGYTQDNILLETEKVRVGLAPGADPGSVIVCESEVQLRPYIDEQVWYFQHSIPVLQSELEIDLPPGRHHAESWHHYEAAKGVEAGPNKWRWEVSQVPAVDLREVLNAPSRSALEGRMSIQWGDAAVKGTDNQWRAIGEWFDQLESHRPDPSPEITAKSLELTAGAADFYQKLSRITDWIQRNIRYFVIERGIGGHQAHPASEIFHHRYGDCKDKATLLISMLQALGMHAYYVPVDDHRGFVDPALPSAFGDHMISAIELPADLKDARLQATILAANGNNYLIFDPTDERTPVGSLRSDLQGSFGLLVHGQESQVFALPVLQPNASGAERVGTFTLAEDGSLRGAVDTTRRGAEGGDIRLYLKRTDEKSVRQNLEQSLGHDIPGVSLEHYKYLEPEALDKPVTLHYEVSAHDYARHVGALMLIRPRIVASDARPVDHKPRTVPIDLVATGSWHDTYDIAIPDSYMIDEMPTPVNVDFDFASYHSTVSAPESGKGRLLRYERDYVVKKIELPAEKQGDYLHLQGAIGSDEKATVVLKKVR